ncbi:carboxymuconolactone decarboxylase family protein [Allosphingosinicella indica]|uniref:Alkylhydroperoxidase AhpD family core domain-containing protein n=1 Tax=Allosphingosinicella indica TaxID=941907 RepID=A0A1X7FZ61_9SPHN|nr:carboxymuconolactone decarboxylase family protein [Allosphingosinicella indica]SMF61410.1 alkylhydroperoxidase AhpD family core domain-containing protein [Allosphingosinicella indica]
MSERLNHMRQVPTLTQKLTELTFALKKSTIGQAILSLIEIRASQLNGCAFCLDMHIKQARLNGERELRIHHVAIWRESSLFSDRERVALMWTEALTRLSPQGVSDDVYAEARAQFSDD